MAAEFEGGSRSRAVLAAIVADPAFGPTALSRPATLFSLFTEYLPDSPGQTGPLLAAAQVDVPESLHRHLAAGTPYVTAIQLAAGKVAARTGLPEEACLWATCEFALALGLVTIDELSESLLDGDFDQADTADWAPVERAPTDWALANRAPAERALTSRGPAERAPGERRPAERAPGERAPAERAPGERGPADRAPGDRTSTEILPGFDRPRQRGSAGPRSGRPPGQRRWLAAITGAILVSAGATGIFLFSQRLVGQQPQRSSSQGDPGAHSASPHSGTATPRHPKASAHPGVPDAGASPGTTSPAAPSPVPVARAYIAAVNARDWPSLWRLGGGNVVLTYQPEPGPMTYPEMVAAFQHTVSVTITSLTSAGDTVTMHVSAVDSAGVTQYYQLNLVIGGGRVISGEQYFLGP